MIIDQPIPELPVRDVRSAQDYFHDKFGFRCGLAQ